MFDNIKKKVAHFYLKKQMKTHRRERAFKNLNTAKTLGIVYVLDEEATWNLVWGIVSQLKQQGITTRTIGVFHGNQKPLYAVENFAMDICSETEMNWCKKPQGTRIDEFIDAPFDLLINLSLHYDYPCNYITQLSKALCKVGVNRDASHKIAYDLEIKPTNLPQNIKELYAEIQYYLLNIKMES